MCTAHAALDDGGEGEPRLITTGYGYGTYTGTVAGHAAFYHTGDNPGYLSFACWIPDLAASVVVLANDATVSVAGLVRQLLPAALEA
jgi:Beta-lactamase